MVVCDPLHFIASFRSPPAELPLTRQATSYQLDKNAEDANRKTKMSKIPWETIPGTPRETSSGPYQNLTSLAPELALATRLSPVAKIPDVCM